MDPTARLAYDAQRSFDNKAFKAGCYAPWVSLYFNTLGNVVACCRSQSAVLGNVTRDRLDDIWNGENLQKMREALARYRFEGGCEFCGWMIEAGDHDGAVAQFFEEFAVPSWQPEWPLEMEFALSNTCNFACVQCCGDWSSTIRAHREQMPPLPKVYDDRFFADLRKYLPHLERAKFYGGEPFLAQENHRIWDMLIEDGLHPHCHVLTNGSIWNKKVERVLEHLTFSVGVSLDAVSKDRLLELRKGSDFDTVMANMKRFRAYTRELGEQMMISFSWMQQNWDELGPMLMHCEEHDYAINVIRVVEPTQFSLFAMAPDELRRVADKLQAQSDRYLPYLNKHRAVWQECIQSLYHNADERQKEAYRQVGSSSAERRAEADHVGHASELLYQQGRIAEAIAEAQKTPESHKDYLHALAIIAHGHRRLGHLDDAETTMAKAMGLTARRPHLFVERAWLRYDQGRLAEGLEDAKQARGMVAANTDPGLEGNVLHVLGLLAAVTGDSAEAEGCIERWLELAGDQAWVRFECSRIYAHDGQRDRAIRELDVALELTNGESSGVRVNCLLDAAKLRRSARAFEAAEDALTEASALAPDRVDVDIELAWLRYAEGRYQQALQCVELGRDRNAAGDDRLAAQLALAAGHALAKLGAYDQAAAEIEAYLQVNRLDATVSELLEALQSRAVEQVALKLTA